MTKEEFIDQAIRNDQSLTIEYMKFDGTISVRTISQIRYSEEFGNGYIAAFCHKRNADRTFKIERIRKIEGWTETPSTIKKKTAFQPNSTQYNTDRVQQKATVKPVSTTTSSKPTYQYSSPTPKTTNQPKEGCYIATMVYGNYDHPQVMVLRKYRDNELARSVLGRLFIKCYYFISPKLVKLLKDNTAVNRRIRKVLDKFVEHISKRDL